MILWFITFKGKISVNLIIHWEEVIEKDTSQLEDVYRKIDGKTSGISMQEKTIFVTPGKSKPSS